MNYGMDLNARLAVLLTGLLLMATPAAAVTTTADQDLGRLASRLGNGLTKRAPASIAAATTVRMISVGTGHSCALLSSGNVKCWGSNGWGELGNGTRKNSPLPLAVTGISNATAISVGGGHSCALLSGGTVKCWGSNLAGELGRTKTQKGIPTPVAIKGIKNATAISAGEWHSCAILADATVKCWGLNESGRLGDGTTKDSLVPVAVKGIANARAVSAGGMHTCVVLVDGMVRCWGHDQLPTGKSYPTMRDTPVPVAVKGITNATAVSAGDDFTCALLSDGRVKCWGFNGVGQLGNGTMSTSPLPISVKGLTNARAISAAIALGNNIDNSYACTILSSGTVKCWGASDGDLPNGMPVAVKIPVALKGIAGASAVSTGDSHACALLSSGAVKCWGRNSSGELGNGTISNEKTLLPVAVNGLP